MTSTGCSNGHAQKNRNPMHDAAGEAGAIMRFETGDAPHWRTSLTVSALMRQVIWSLVPVFAASVWFFGVGILLNATIAVAVSLVCEAAMLRLRGRPVNVFLTDGSAALTALLLALCLPPLTPWWVTATGCVFAIVVAKHLYGGLGQNVFNPAMGGYVVILVSFPDYVAQWLPPTGTDAGHEATGAMAQLQFFLNGVLPGDPGIDAVTRPTPLDAVKTGLGQKLTMEEIGVGPTISGLSGPGWHWINALAALGGIWLLRKRVIRWHIPVAMLASIALAAAIAWVADPSTSASPLFHLFSGGTMLGAFFIATDPISAPSSDHGRIIFGASLGLLIWILRTWGAYPDGIAFAVLLMNMTVPLIDRYTRPRIYGQTG